MPHNGNNMKSGKTGWCMVERNIYRKANIQKSKHYPAIFYIYCYLLLSVVENN